MNAVVAFFYQRWATLTPWWSEILQKMVSFSSCLLWGDAVRNRLGKEKEDTEQKFP